MNIEKLAIEHGKASNTVMRYNEVSQQMLLDGYEFTKSELEAFAKAYAQQSSEPVAKQPWPSHNWCVGCDPDNCSGCGTEPNERRKQAFVPLEKYNKLLDALKDADEMIGIEPFEHVAQEAADAHRNIRELIAEAEGKEG